MDGAISSALPYLCDASAGEVSRQFLNCDESPVMHDNNEQRARQKSNVWRAALILGLIALAFYASAFFYLEVK